MEILNTDPLKKNEFSYELTDYVLSGEFVKFLSFSSIFLVLKHTLFSPKIDIFMVFNAIFINISVISFLQRYKL
jgi:hypothetical protein